MRKVDDGEEKNKKKEKKEKKKKKKKRMAFLVATMSLPAVYRPNDDRWNATRSCQFMIGNDLSNYVNYLAAGWSSYRLAS